MSPRSSASQIRKVPTVDNAAAFQPFPPPHASSEHLADTSVGVVAILSRPHDAGGQCRFIVRCLEAQASAGWVFPLTRLPSMSTARAYA